MGLAKAKVMNGETDIDLNLLVAFEKNNTMKFNDGLMKRYLGEIFLNLEDQYLPEADTWITNAIGVDTDTGMLYNLGMDYVCYRDLCKKQGREAAAAESHARALKIFSECGCAGRDAC